MRKLLGVFAVASVACLTPVSESDAGNPDAGQPVDGGRPDAGSPDAGSTDSGSPDAGGVVDAGLPDAGAASDGGTNGQTCTGMFDCASRDCVASVCVACSVANPCPNSGDCQSGVCKAGPLGPCAISADCAVGNLVCDLGQCKQSTGGFCFTTEQCIHGQRCESSACEPAHCRLVMVDHQQIPPSSDADDQAMGLQANGEIFVTAPQNTPPDVRRYRVRPGGDAGIVEQDPTMAPLLALAGEILAIGRSDAQGTASFDSTRSFYWQTGDGAVNGQVAVQIKFTGANSDVGVDFANYGRFTKCGDDFYFATSGSGTSGRVLLRFHTPQPVGSGSTAQVLTASAARRGDAVFPTFVDFTCTATTLWVLGADASGVAGVQALDPLTLSVRGVPAMLPSIVLFPADVGQAFLAVANDDFAFVTGNSNELFELADGGATRLGYPPAAFGGWSYFNANASGFVVLDYSSTLSRFAPQYVSDGSPVPLGADCQWQ